MKRDRFAMFRYAQDRGAGRFTETYSTAMFELATGAKVSCWMWYVFPVLSGVGMSEMSRRFGIAGLREAREYLRDRVLGLRLRVAAEIVECRRDVGIRGLFGNPVDAMKFHACMTLFDAVEPGGVFGRCLDEFFGGRRDARTMRLIGRVKSAADRRGAYAV